jgi:hypothetical protein
MLTTRHTQHGNGTHPAPGSGRIRWLEDHLHRLEPTQAQRTAIGARNRQPGRGDAVTASGHSLDSCGRANRILCHQINSHRPAAGGVCDIDKEAMGKWALSP